MDNTGIVVVPQEKIMAVLTAAEELDRRDADLAERLKTDGSSPGRRPRSSKVESESG